MRIRVLSYSTLALFLALSCWPVAASAQPKTTIPLSGSRIVGVWQFNKDLSSPTQDTQSATPTQRPSGGSRGGRGGGGGYGGRGGRGGGGGFGGGGGTDQTQMLQARKFLTEVMTPPETVTIVADETTVTFTDDHGVVRKYTTNGKKEKIDIGGPKLDATTKWDGMSLTQDLGIGQAMVTEAYTLSEDGNQLTEVIKVTNSGGGGQSPTREIRHVFTRST